MNLILCVTWQISVILCITWQISASGWQLGVLIIVLISETILPTQVYYFVVKEWVRIATGEKKRILAKNLGLLLLPTENLSSWTLRGYYKRPTTTTPVSNTLLILGFHKVLLWLISGIVVRNRHGDIISAFFVKLLLFPLYFIKKKWQERGKEISRSIKRIHNEKLASSHPTYLRTKPQYSRVQVPKLPENVHVHKTMHTFVHSCTQFYTNGSTP